MQYLQNTVKETSNVTSITEVPSTSTHLFAGMWRRLVSILTTLYEVAIIFHRRVWYRTLSLRVFDQTIIRTSSSSPRLPNFISVAASIAELANGEKSRTISLNHSPSLSDPGNQKACASEQQL